MAYAGAVVRHRPASAQCSITNGKARSQRGKVLVVAPAWVGDMVMAHTLVPGLVEQGASVEFLAPAATASLATRMPGVAAVHRIDTRHGQLGLAARKGAAKALKPLGFKQAIVLPNSFKSALTPALAGIPRRSGFLGEWRLGVLNDRRVLDKERLPRMVDRFAALADVAPAPPRLQADAQAQRRLLAQHGLASRRPVVALCPGADYGSAKRWPVEHFRELARRCADAGAQVWVLGGTKDAPAAAAIAADGLAADLTGRTSLPDAVDLLAAASAVVSNDSGLMHVAAALNVPLVALYGSTSPGFTPPLSPRAAVVERTLDCRPCFQRDCPLGHLACLRNISAAHVFDVLQRVDGFAATLRSATAANSATASGSVR